MEDYNKIVESLGVRYIKAKNVKVLKSVNIENFYDVENIAILLDKGEIYFGNEQKKVEAGDILFVPGGKAINIQYGEAPAVKINYEEFVSNKDKYLGYNADSTLIGNLNESFISLSFEAKVFDSVNFFTSLDIPAFVIQKNDLLAEKLTEIMQEELSKKVGHARIIKVLTERFIIEVIRYILNKNLFVEQLATNSNYFKDPRLIDIFTYIKNNLAGDLSNHILANVAAVSEDYVGQYFKMLTSINPQDYIEYQRMEQAVNLLRTSKHSIRDIGRMVGYKDTAYFCRRFKMMFGIPAGKMRRRESLVNV
jgi:AraC-like DNA-binding protein